jgi:hypothetical protein
MNAKSAILEPPVSYAQISHCTRACGDPDIEKARVFGAGFGSGLDPKQRHKGLLGRRRRRMRAAAGAE